MYCVHLLLACSLPLNLFLATSEARACFHVNEKLKEGEARGMGAPRAADSVFLRSLNRTKLSLYRLYVVTTGWCHCAHILNGQAGKEMGKVTSRLVSNRPTGSLLEGMLDWGTNTSLGEYSTQEVSDSLSC